MRVSGRFFLSIAQDYGIPVDSTGLTVGRPGLITAMRHGSAIEIAVGSGGKNHVQEAETTLTPDQHGWQSRPADLRSESGDSVNDVQIVF
jgi:hypothetical protein